MASLPRNWWRTGTCYQIWPASYKDSNGDGLGDFQGIISTLDYLQDLGVDIIWISPIFASPQIDMGYDISDYEAVDPRYGTMEDMDKLIQAVHEKGMRLILDLVINHTSDQHAWFVESKKSKNNLKSDWYIWRDPKYDSLGHRQPPNNWGCFFGGTAWEYVPSRDQYYLHLFAKEQPDINWESGEARKAIRESAIEFWLKKGIDGFRVDTGNLYSKDQDFPDAEVTELSSPYQDPRPFVVNGPRIHEYIREMRHLAFDKYGDVMLVGECGSTPASEAVRYVSASSHEYSMIIDFDLVSLGGTLSPDKHDLQPHTLSEFKCALSKPQTLNISIPAFAERDAWPTVFLENHDCSRSINRFTPGSLPEYRAPAAKLLATLVTTLTGTLFIYQGQEIGMTNVPASWPETELRDISALNYLTSLKERFPNDAEIYKKGLLGLNAVGRDNARTPIQWTSQPPFAGFISPRAMESKPDAKPWMRVNDNFKEVNVEMSIQDPNSVLNYWRYMLKLRKKWQDVLNFGEYVEFGHEDPALYVYIKRTETDEAGGAVTAVIALNFSNQGKTWRVYWQEFKDSLGLFKGEIKVKKLISNLDDLATVDFDGKEKDDDETEKAEGEEEGEIQRWFVKFVTSHRPNPKAFAVANPGKLAKQGARSHDIKEKRLHVPLVDRLPEEAPPLVVAVVGPPGVGKTTLIKSLIRRYTKQTLSSPKGPLTVVTSKRRRLTFLECPSHSLSAMIDISKIADIVLLMIDGNYGFEMETMEFLNALSSAGMPGNVFGILTHLDLFRKQSTLAATKKRLKHRFWSELYQGAKLFYLSGVINGRYPDREVHNLSRFLSVMKNPRPLIWRNSHPYCLADRFLDITPPTAIEENPKCDRTVALYGYLRGTNFPAVDARVHVPGVGDLRVSHVEALPDPCPTPFMDQAMAQATGKKGRRRLGEKQKILFAPMSDVGGVLVDKDAVYIDIKSSTFDRDAEDVEDRGFGEQMMLGLQSERRLLGEANDGVRLFQGGNTVNGTNTGLDATGDEGRKQKRHARLSEADQDDEADDDEGSEDGDEPGSESDDENDLGAPRQFSSWNKENEDEVDGDGELAFADSDSDLGSVSSVDNQEFDREDDLDENGESDEGEFDDDDDKEEDNDDDGGLRWKERMADNVKRLNAIKIAYRAVDLSRMMYDDTLSAADVVRRWKGQDSTSMDGAADSDEEDDFFKKTGDEDQQDGEDRTIPIYNYEELARKWQDIDEIESLRRRFAKTSVREGEDGSDDSAGSDGSDEFGFDDEDDDSEGDGEFEDLETGEKVENEPNDEKINLAAEREANARRKEELKLRFEEEDREGFGKRPELKDGNAEAEQEFGEDDWYDAQKAALQKQADINNMELSTLDPAARARASGFRAGTYARIVLENVPYEFSRLFSPMYPVIIGGLAPTEERFGYVQVRIKRHRWHKKILKTNDPLIFSLGWRRFQSLPIYSISDSRTRNRMLKYTPEHMHCFGTFWGPLVAPNTGFCAVQSFNNSNPGFRIAATGTVLNVDSNTEIVKKLKLTGYPYKIFRNTAFIKDMFSTSLEIAKFEGASIRTVSGIRGQIKRALAKPEGHFRATFEDKILMSDIVFLRAWYPVKPHRFYNPVTDLLDVDPEAATNEEGEGQDSQATSKQDKSSWAAMRLTGQIRRELGIPTPLQKDSKYTPVVRPTRHFNPLRVPRQLAANLPFKSQITTMKPHSKIKGNQTYLQKRAVVVRGEEKKARDLMQKLQTMRNEKVAKRAAKKEEKRAEYRKKVAENEGKREEREKRERDDYWRREGRKRKGDSQGGGAKRLKT